MLRVPATLLAAVLSLTLALALTPTALAQEPQEQEIGLLFTHTAKNGTLKPVEGKPRFTLKLHRVAPQAVWFSDRPVRQSGQIPMRGFVRAWAGFGFETDHPNAALTVLNAGRGQDTVVLELGEPRYRAERRTVRYPARILDEATGNLSHLESERDRRVRRSFRAASLFIDDGTAPVINGCVIQTWTRCTGANLAGANLAGVDLGNAILTRANLAGANLTNADLNHSDLGSNPEGQTDLSRANLTNADLSGAYINEGNINLANFTGTDLTDTDLSDTEADDVDLSVAILCNTAMPDSSTNNRDCQSHPERR